MNNSTITSALLLSATLAVVGISPANAMPQSFDNADQSSMHDHKKGNKHGRHGMMKKVFAQLNLTETQQQQMEAIKNDSTMDHKAKRKAVKQVLTTEQRTQFKQIRAEHRKHRHGMMKKVFAQLNLTETQQQQMEAIKNDSTMDHKAKREAVEQVLTKEQRAQFKQIRAEHKKHRRGQWKQRFNK